MGRTIYYNTSWLSLYATRVLPQSYTLISREDYELYEAHGDLDRDDQEKDEGNGNAFSQPYLIIRIVFDVKT